MAAHQEPLSSSSSDDGSASPEYKAIQQSTDILVSAIQQCISTVTSRCFSKSLISEDVVDYIHTNNPDSDKASRIVTCVRRSIKNEVTKFHEFVEVLQAERYLDSAVNQLLEKYNEWFVERAAMLMYYI